MAAYPKQEEGGGGLHQLLQENAFNDVALGDQVLHVLVSPRMKAIVAEGAEHHAHARVNPIHHNWNHNS